MSFPIPLPTLRAAFIALVMGLPSKVYDAVCRDRATVPLVTEMSAKVYALVRRFAAIAVHVHNGTLRQPPKRRAGGTRRAVSPRKPSLLPSRFGWLGRMAWETGPVTERLDQMVRCDLEMVALLTAAPQAKPILRSLFWMLGRPLPDILRRPTGRRARPRPAPPSRFASRRCWARDATPTGPRPTGPRGASRATPGRPPSPGPPPGRAPKADR